MTTTPATYAKAHGSGVWHYLNRGAATHRTMCGRDAGLMARFNASDLPSGERSAPICGKCRTDADA